MANMIAVYVMIGIITVIVLVVVIAYVRLIIYRRNLRREYGRRAGREPPCCLYDALPLCFGSPYDVDGAHCKPCPCFMKYEPDPNEPPAASYMEAKRNAGDDTSRVPEIGNQPPPSYDVTHNTDPEVSAPKSDEIVDDAQPPPDYNTIKNSDQKPKSDVTSDN